MRRPWLRRTRLLAGSPMVSESSGAPLSSPESDDDGLRGPWPDPVMSPPVPFAAADLLAPTADAGFLMAEAGSRRTLGGPMPGGW